MFGLGQRITPSQAVRRFRELELRQMRSAIGNGLRAATREAMKGAENERAETGRLARALWGGRKGASWRTFQKRQGKSTLGKALKGKFFGTGVPPLIVGVSRVRLQGNSQVGGVQASGMARLIEKGGRIRPHPIRRGSGVIRHPGAEVVPRPILPRRAERARGLLPGKLEYAMKRAIEKAGLA